MYLFYGNYAEEDIAFAGEIENLGHALNLEVTYALVVPSEQFPAVPGFITADVMDRKLPVNRRRFCYFVCGPPGMIQTMKTTLHSLGIPQRQATIEEYEMA